MSSVNKTATYSGHVGKYNTSPWTSCIDATTGDVAGNGEMLVQAYMRNDGGYECKRGFLEFDTSTLTGATVSAATLYVYCKNLQNATAYRPALYVVLADNANPVTVNDYNNESDTSYGNVANNNSENEWKTITLTTASIVTDGTTKLALKLAPDQLRGFTPGAGEVWNWDSQGYAEANKPYLTIVYTTVPTVTTGAVTALQPISATLGGNITDAGGGTVSTAGVCWATTENPTTSSSKTSTSTTSGAFTVSATGLLPGTLYHYRAYVTTENSTQYGSDTTFRTPGGAILFNLL